MSDNPLDDTPARAARVRDRARHLWEADGRPAGQEDEFLERARELIAIEDSAGAGLLPVTPDRGPPGTVVDEAAIEDNLGEFPGRLTDQGDRRQTPMTREELRRRETS